MAARTRSPIHAARCHAARAATIATTLAAGLAHAGATPTALHAQPATDPRPSEPAPVVPPEDDPRDAHPIVQLAIVLDTSGSMSGLIEQAKAQLWSIVNELAASSHGGVTPELQVALFQYGTPSLGADNGYIRRILPLTTDLDAVSQELFSLTTNGGAEYCGWAIRTARRSLRWSPMDSDLKMIVIAGNEPFTQGAVDFRTSVPDAAERGIIVNTIHCGPHATGMNSGWYAGAQLGHGTYSSIDHNQSADPIATPYDAELTDLSRKINATYLAYGRRGAAMKARQSAQDANAAGLSRGVAAERAASKASSLYRNSHWDLVDAYRDGTVDLETVDDEHLPEAMRAMSIEERRAHVREQLKERQRIQTRIAQLQTKRRAHIAAERRERAERGEDTLGAAMLVSIREQAERVGLEFPDPPAPESSEAADDKDMGKNKGDE